jgi:hypothetical protein
MGHLSLDCEEEARAVAAGVRPAAHLDINAYIWKPINAPTRLVDFGLHPPSWCSSSTSVPSSPLVACRICEAAGYYSSSCQHTSWVCLRSRDFQSGEQHTRLHSRWSTRNDPSVAWQREAAAHLRSGPSPLYLSPAAARGVKTVKLYLNIIYHPSTPRQRVRPQQDGTTSDEGATLRGSYGAQHVDTAIE